MESYQKIKNIRYNMIAPVDIIGCYSYPNKCNDKKLYVLVSLILSSQTKDEINFQTMINLCRNLNSKNMKIMKVKYTLTENIFQIILSCDDKSEIYLFTKRKGEIINLNKNIDFDTSKLTIDNLIYENNLRELIKPTGFFNKKYNTIMTMARHIKEHGYPSTLKECLSIKGFGRKMSLLYLNKFYTISGISVDTHVHRISNLLGLVNTKTPDETSKALSDIVDYNEWNTINNVLVGYGQILCHSRKPKCFACVVKEKCKINKL